MEKEVDSIESKVEDIELENLSKLDKYSTDEFKEKVMRTICYCAKLVINDQLVDTFFAYYPYLMNSAKGVRYNKYLKLRDWRNPTNSNSDIDENIE